MGCGSHKIRRPCTGANRGQDQHQGLLLLLGTPIAIAIAVPSFFVIWAADLGTAVIAPNFLRVSPNSRYSPYPFSSWQVLSWSVAASPRGLSISPICLWEDDGEDSPSWPSGFVFFFWRCLRFRSSRFSSHWSHPDSCHVCSGV